MKESNAKSRMQDIFSSYHTILRRHGLSWIVTDKQKVEVAHESSAIRALALKNGWNPIWRFQSTSSENNSTAFCNTPSS